MIRNAAAYRCPERNQSTAAAPNRKRAVVGLSPNAQVLQYGLQRRLEAAQIVADGPAVPLQRYDGVHGQLTRHVQNATAAATDPANLELLRAQLGASQPNMAPIRDVLR